MITITFPDGTCEEYDLSNESDARAADHKITARIRSLKKGETIIIKGGDQ